MPFVILLALYWLGGMVRHRVNRRQLLLLAVPVACWLLIAVDLTPFLVPVTRSLASAVWVQTALKAVTILAAAVVVGTALGLPAELKIVRGAAVFVLALFAVFCLGAHALNNNEIREWACKLNGGHTACRRVYIQCNQQIKTYSRTPDWAAVLIDVDRRGAQARVSVNGQVLADGPRSVNWYDSRVDLKVSDLDQKASLLRKSVESMRQWRVIHVPTSWLNLNGPNLIEVESTAAGAATVYGDYPPVNGRRKILSFARSAGKLWTSASSLEERVLSPIPAMQVESLSWLKGPEGRSLADLSPSPGVQTGQYRIHLVLGYKQRPGRLGDRPVPTSVIGKSVITNLRPAQFVSNPDPVASGKTADVKPVERFWQRCEIAVGPQPADSSHLLIRLNGKLRSAGARETASLAFLLKGPGKAEPVNLPGGMHDLAATVLGSRFAISQEVPYWLIDGGLSALQIDVLSTPDIVFQDARLEIQPVKRPDINRDRFFIF
jgi:hypothetical protein